MYLEVHPPLAEEQEKYVNIRLIVQNAILDAISEENTKYRVILNENAIETAIEEQNGILVTISR